MTGLPRFSESPTVILLGRAADWFEHRARREFVKRAAPRELMIAHQSGPVTGEEQ